MSGSSMSVCRLFGPRKRAPEGRAGRRWRPTSEFAKKVQKVKIFEGSIFPENLVFCPNVH